GRPCEPVDVDVRDFDGRRTGGPGDLKREIADRAGTGDEDAIAQADAALAAGPDSDRERLEERAGVVGELVRERKGEVLVDRDVARERSVDRRRREEADVATEVVAPFTALRTTAAGNAGLQRHAPAERMLGRPR